MDDANPARPASGQQPPAAPARQPYAPPRLSMFGSILERTFTVSNMGINDGGASPNHKTS
jgi:hypothetical protein